MVIFGECRRNTAEVVNLYGYPERRAPTDKIFRKLEQ
jgi:hypothetical protein